MRVLLLTQYYYPEPHEKWRDLAARLRRQGHDVEVLTGFPCYPQGETYAGYRQALPASEEVDGVRVVRTPQWPDHSRSALRRMLYYVSFAMSAVLSAVFLMRRPDVIYVYQSAMPIGLAAWTISRLRRAPYVLDLADLWPESVAASGMLKSRLAENTIRAAMRFIYRGAQHINVITEGYRRNLEAMGVPQDKLSLIHCWPGTDAYEPPAGVTPDPESLTITYAGAIGPCQDLGAVLQALARIPSDLNVRFIVAGDGVQRESLKNQAAELGLANVSFVGRVGPAEVARLYAESDLLLVHLKPDPMSAVSIPSKTFTCMAGGRPLLMAVDGEARRLVEQHKCGVMATPSSPADLVDAIQRFAALSQPEQKRLGEAARNAYLEHYNPDVLSGRVVQTLCDAHQSARQRSGLYRRYVKRAIDIAVAAPLLFLLSPVMLLVACCVRLILGGPVLFRQQRPGLGARPFHIFKFRTMTDTRDPSGELLSDEERLNWFGRLLRSTSLDELPGLWNVLRGDMSLVGPRPLLMDYLPLYTPRQAQRHDVRPGVTGLAQVNGRNGLDWQTRLELDARYVEDCSLWLDMKIAARTVWCVVSRRGVTAERHATCPPFQGSTATQAHTARAA